MHCHFYIFPITSGEPLRKPDNRDWLNLYLPLKMEQTPLKITDAFIQNGADATQNH